MLKSSRAPGAIAGVPVTLLAGIGDCSDGFKI